MKTRIFAALALMSLSINAAAENECTRAPRNVVYHDQPVDVFISNDTQRAEVTFPEPFLEGIYVEVMEGMDIYRTPIDNKLAFMASDPIYTGLVTVDGPSKQSYIIRLIS